MLELAQKIYGRAWNYLRHIRRPRERARIDVVRMIPTVEIGKPSPCVFRVRNTSQLAWPSRGRCPVQFSYHWLNPSGEAFIFDCPRTPLPRDVLPGEELVLTCVVAPPNTTGDYLLEFDLVRENVTWFKDAGSTTMRAPCRVVRGQMEDFGEYEDVWKKADLNRDYWSIVGPGSKEEFESLGRHKRQILIDLGLRPDSRVLDVGCGTGLLTGALLDYLGPQGIYYGTDIGAEAITFCRSKYQRPNFFFLQNEMCRIPIIGRTFDFITLYSVFTHIYPKEIGAMLVDLKRLLDPNGVILADAFVSRQVDGFTGNRAKVDINEPLLENLFTSAGLQFQSIEHLCASTGETARRVFYKLSHAAIGSTKAAA
jgi:ubiquinone/menaquinone biosynthesis C-methylase UbiE